MQQSAGDRERPHGHDVLAEVDQAVENMTALIEPFMLVFLGVTIGGLVVAMYLPIFKMAGAISN